MGLGIERAARRRNERRAQAAAERASAEAARRFRPGSIEAVILAFARATVAASIPSAPLPVIDQRALQLTLLHRWPGVSPQAAQAWREARARKVQAAVNKGGRGDPAWVKACLEHLPGDDAAPEAPTP